jgi:hypothetical protein
VERDELLSADLKFKKKKKKYRGKMNKQQIWNSRFFKYHLIHFCHSARVSPETIVNGRKTDAFSLAIERR